MLNLFFAELRRDIALQRSNPLDLIGSIIIFPVMFCMMSTCAGYLARTPLDAGRVGSMFVSYLAWLLMTKIYSLISSSIESESARGTLMQLLMSPLSIRAVLFSRASACTLRYTVILVITAWLIVLFNHIHISLSLSLIPFVGMAMLSATGLGFMFGAATLRFKSFDFILQLLHYAVFFAIMVPFEQWPKYAPIIGILLPTGASGAGMRAALLSNSFSMEFFWLSLINAALYLGGGLWLFGKAHLSARRLGLLGAF